jgi:hypothetical protein
MDISRTDRVRNVIKRRKVNWTGHVLRRNGLLKHIIGGKIEGNVGVTGRRGRRPTQLLNNLKETRKYQN